MSPLHKLPSVVTLQVIDSGHATRHFQLESDHSVFLGRSANCGVRLSGADVSEMHCYIRYEDGKLWVEDWMSRTGTLVNGAPIAERVELRLSDTLQVGPNQVLLCDRPETATAAPHPNRFAASAAQDPTLGLPSLTLDPREGSALPDGAPEMVTWPDPTAGDPSLQDDLSFDSRILALEDEPAGDDETIAVLRAEIEHLQAALAVRDAECLASQPIANVAWGEVEEDDGASERIKALVDEVNRSHERVLLLEEMLRTAEDAVHGDQEERRQLETWIDEIESRVSQRDAEHQAEIESLRQQLVQSKQVQDTLRQRLQGDASDDEDAAAEQLASLQQSHQQLQAKLAQSRQRCVVLEQQLEKGAIELERARQPRATLVEAHANGAAPHPAAPAQQASVPDVLRSRTPQTRADADQRIKVLREHLREIHNEEKKLVTSGSLTARLARLWQRVQ